MEKRGPSVGFISNGNRTWAKREYHTDTPTVDQYLEAYFKGSERIKGVIEVARDEGFSLIAPWGLSDKNITNRPEHEKQCLYQVFEHYLIDLRDNFLHRPENANVCFRHIGRRDRLLAEAPHIIKLIDEITEQTRERIGLIVAVALDYGGRDDQHRAMKLWFEAGCPNGSDGVKDFLDLPKQGAIDLIIRTGHKEGEAVRTNEYLWPYIDETRIIVSTCLLPDYTKELFKADIERFRAEKQNRGK